MPSLTRSSPWTFVSGFRRNAFGWNGTRKAIERMEAAVSEIERAARADPALAGVGAVLLLEKLSPALSHIDSSSGALGNATHGVVQAMVPLISAAPVSRRIREKWLRRLFDAIQGDDPPYIESLGDHWGELCAEPALASQWADELLPFTQRVMSDRRKGAHVFTKSGTLCFSALFYAGRLDELLALLALDPKPYWHEQQWAARALAARGDVDAAVQLIDGLRSAWAPDGALSAIAEELLLKAGRIEEAYSRYAIRATSTNTNIATFRSIAKRYPGVEAGRILGDLIAATPGEEGKWFATAKTLKQYELALALARRSPVDPKTLLRAARDHIKAQPAFALEVALTALYRMARGHGYELTGADVLDARQHAAAAAAALGTTAALPDRIADHVSGEGAAAQWVRQCLGVAAR